MTVPGERWWNVYSSQIGHGQQTKKHIPFKTSLVNQFIGVTYRDMGDSKATPSPRTLLQHGWQLMEDESLGIPAWLCNLWAHQSLLSWAFVTACITPGRTLMNPVISGTSWDLWVVYFLNPVKCVCFLSLNKPPQESLSTEDVATEQSLGDFSQMGGFMTVPRGKVQGGSLSRSIKSLK